jgi:hypothetical protein
VGVVVWGRYEVAAKGGLGGRDPVGPSVNGSPDVLQVGSILYRSGAAVW